VTRQNGHVVGYPDLGKMTGFRDLMGVMSVDRQNGHGPRKRGQPARDAALLFVPTNLAPRPVSGTVLMAHVTNFFHCRGECLTSSRAVTIARWREVGVVGKPSRL